MIETVKYLPGIGKSDHLVLTFEFMCYIELKERTDTKFNYNKGNYDAIRADLSNIDINNVGVQMSWRLLAEKLSNSIEKNIPKCAVKAERHQNPYIDRDTARAIKAKRTKWLKYKYCKNHLTYENYKKARNVVGDHLKRCKYTYEKNIAEQSKNNPKYVRSKSKTKSGINSMEINGEKTTNDRDIAEEFNRHFISVFTIENDQIPEPTEQVKDVITNVIINEEVTMKYLQEINPDKSQGPDNIHPRLIKECKNSICKPLTEVFKKSLDEGTLPREWKEANVTAIFKAGKKAVWKIIDQLVSPQFVVEF